MKEITIGDISIYSEDGDTWEDLIKVIRKANKTYIETIKEIEGMKKETWIKKIFRQLNL